MRRPRERDASSCRPRPDARAGQSGHGTVTALGKGSFIFSPLPPPRSTSILAQGCIETARRTSPALAAWAPAGPIDSSALARWVVHVRLATPARPNSSAALTATMSGAGLLRMRVPRRMGDTRRSDTECRRSLAGASPAEATKLDPRVHVVHGPYQTQPVAASISGKNELTRKALDRDGTTSDSRHIDTSDHVECAGQFATHGDKHVHCGRMHRDVAGLQIRASRVRLTARESARTVLSSVITAGTRPCLSQP